MILVISWIHNHKTVAQLKWRPQQSKLGC